MPTFKEQQHQNFDEMKKKRNGCPFTNFYQDMQRGSISESLNYLCESQWTLGRRSREILKKTLVGEAADEFHPPNDDYILV